ncbi:MAG TPA: ATP-binding cassette domain-containing protein [Oscillospiraceae bacterium]|nr:ATP-binding cassette domain-containing protein [Oscillospiraceae bacterium]
MIEVKNLSKHYGEKKAVDDISFTIEDGIILGFLGPNGAGKSTTMNILTGYISATDGEVLINGANILEEPQKAKAQIGYLPEMPPLYMDMTVKEYLDFIFDLKKCKLVREQHIGKICELVKITDVYDRIIKNLSKGYKQRVGIAQALINNPPIIILDEPTVGLDPKQIVEIKNLIKHLGQKRTVILSSHILSEIQAVCDKVIIINKGKVAANDTAENISKAISSDHKLIVSVEGPKDDILKCIKGIKGVVSVEAGIEKEPKVFEYTIETEDKADIRRELFRRLSEKKWAILSLGTTELTLEDIFLKITMGEGIEIPTLKETPEAPANDNETKADVMEEQKSETADEEKTDGGDE